MSGDSPRVLNTDYVPIIRGDFAFRTGIVLCDIPGCEDVKRIVAPRDVTSISSVLHMPTWYLYKLVGNIGLTFDSKYKVYRGCAIRFEVVDPLSLWLGQRYVYRNQYASIQKSLPELFDGFCTSWTFSQHLFCLILGKDHSGDDVLAHLVPPIVEQHGDQLVLMDGIHRNFAAAEQNSHLAVMVIENVKTPFPCAVHRCSEVTALEERPEDPKSRYLDLKPELFRNPRYVGIDG